MAKGTRLLSTTAHFSLSSWAALRDQLECDASGFEFLVATFDMADSSLLIAMLPVSQCACGQETQPCRKFLGNSSLLDVSDSKSRPS